MKKSVSLLLVGGGATLGVGAFLALRKSAATTDAVEKAVSGAPGGRGIVKLRLTGYWPFTARPDEQRMEGAPVDRRSKPLHTVEDFLAGKADHVSLSGDDAIFPYGQRIDIPWGDRTIIGRVTDTGGHFRGAGKLYRTIGEEPIDVCVLSSETKIPNVHVSARIVAGDSFESGKLIATGGLKGQEVLVGWKEMYGCGQDILGALPVGVSRPGLLRTFASAARGAVALHPLSRPLAALTSQAAAPAVKPIATGTGSAIKAAAGGKVNAATPSPQAQQAVQNAATHAQASAQKILAHAQKIKNPKFRAVISSIGNKHLGKAKAAAKLTPVQAHRVMGDEYETPSRRYRNRRQMLAGDLFSAGMTALDPGVANAAIQAMISQGSEDDAVVTLTDDYNDLSSYVDQLTQINQASLVSSGNALLGRMTDLGTAYDNAGDSDPSLPGKVAAIHAAYENWLVGPNIGSGPGTAAYALNQAMASGALPGGAGGATTTATPTITSLSASVGVPGDQIIVTGSNLSGATGANFNGVAASIAAQSATQATVTVPQGASAGPLNIVTPGGTASAAFSIGTGAAPPGFDTGGGGYGGGGGGGGGYDSGGDGGGDGGDYGSADQYADDTGDTGDTGANNGPDPDNPGYLMDGSPDPSATGSDTPMDTGDGGTDEQGDSTDYEATLAAFRESGGEEDPFEDGSDTSVQGDFNPWALLYDPAGELYRNYRNPSAPGAYQGTTATKRAPGPAGASAAVAASLAASKQRLSALQAQLDAFRLQQAQANPYTAAVTALSTPSGSMDFPDPNNPDPNAGASTVMGDDEMEHNETLRQFREEGVDPFEDDVEIFGEGDIETQDVQDIEIEQFKPEITDDEPDWERRRASLHAGASYMQYNEYPPHGASGGQEGGVADNEEYTTVFGGIMDPKNPRSGYSHGLDILGATPRGGFATGVKKALPQRAGFTIKKSPVLGRKFTSLVVRRQPAHDPKRSIANARTAGNRAVSVGNKLLALAKKDKIHGALARKPIRAALTAVQLKKLAKGAVDAGKKALKGADKHEKVVKKNTDRVKAGAKAARALTHIHGEGADIIFGLERDEALDSMLHEISDDVDIFGHDIEVFGQDAMSSAPPDPNNPGYLMDGSPDPAYAGAGGDVAATAGPPDYGIGPAPTTPPPLVAGQDYDPDPAPNGNDFNFYSSDPNVGASFGAGIAFSPVPVGAVIYDGTIKPAFMDLGSYTTFFSQLPGAGPAGGPGSGYQWHDDGWWSFRSGDYAGPPGSGDLRLKHADDSSAGSMIARVANSYNYNWGPLIGNPNGSLKGLRYDVGAGQWFWFRDSAPAWATAADDQVRLNQAILDYQAQIAAAAADAAAQAAQDKLDAAQAAAMQKQQAAEDTQNAHQLEMEQAQAEAAAQTQALADQAAAQQQQTADTSYAAQLQAEAQAQATLEQSQALTEARIEQQAEETAARLQAMQPPGADEGAPDDGSGDQYADTGDTGGDTGDTGETDYTEGSADEAASSSEETVLGLRGTKRIKHRAARRRAGL